MTDDEDDAELKAAIAASLRQVPSMPARNGATVPNQDVVDLTTDSAGKFTASDALESSDTEDLEKAIALSLEDLQPSPLRPQDIVATSNIDEGHNTDESQEANHVKSYGIPGLGRRKQEQDRLARVERKRKGTVSPPPLKRIPKVAKTETSNRILESKNPHSIRDENAYSQINELPQEQSPKNISPGIRRPPLQYPSGVVKKTWAYSYPRGGDVKIEEVLQKNDLEVAVLSSFQWDIEWILSKIDLKKTKLVLAMQAKDAAQKQQYRSETASMPFLRLCFPPMDGQVNCMHSKLMLLFYPLYLRVVVPSANLVPYDWGETGVMENTVFLIDLPRLQKNTKSPDETLFYQDLVYFLRAMELQEAVLQRVPEFDFTKTRGLAFVHTIGGSHTDDAWKRTGHCGLGRAVEALGLHTSKPIEIDFVTSSVGSLTAEFLRSLYLAAQGDDGLTEYTLRTSKSFPTHCRNDVSRKVKKDAGSEWNDKFRIYFPSLKTVRESKGGPSCGGTICFQSKWYNGANFPREAMRDCRSRREGMLMHNKMLFVRPQEKFDMGHGITGLGWAYVGSANLSESAWGRLVQDRATKGAPKLNCRNWESGVLMPITTRANPAHDLSKESSSPSKHVGLDIFGDQVPLPMEIPARPYGAGKPWFYTEQ